MNVRLIILILAMSVMAGCATMDNLFGEKTTTTFTFPDGTVGSIESRNDEYAEASRGEGKDKITMKSDRKAMPGVIQSLATAISAGAVNSIVGNNDSDD